MSKRIRFTTITPLPPRADRAAVVAVLHDFEAMIDLNPLVVARHRIVAPPAADPDEAACAWFRLTDALVPWLSSTAPSASSPAPTPPSAKTVSYTCAFLPLPDGLQTHCRAPLGVDIRDRWTVAGTPAAGPRPPVRELGLDALGAPAAGLYVREDVDLRCNVLLAGFVKKTLKRAHAALAARLAQLAEAPAVSSARGAKVLPPPPPPPTPPAPPVLDTTPPRRIRIGVHPQTLAEARAVSPVVQTEVTDNDETNPFEPPPMGGLPPCAADARARHNASPPQPQPTPPPSPPRLLPRTYRPLTDGKGQGRRRRDRRMASAERTGSSTTTTAGPSMYPEMNPYADAENSSSCSSLSSSSSYSDNGKNRHKTTLRQRPTVLFAELSDDESGDSGTEPRMVVPVILDTGRGRSF